MKVVVKREEWKSTLLDGLVSVDVDMTSSATIGC